MEKYLFADGTNVIREVRSDDELQSLIQSATEPGKIRIWIFNTSEWISLAEFNRRKQPIHPVNPIKKPASPQVPSVNSPRRSGWKTALIVTAAIVTALLVYNFTRVTWNKISPQTIVAARPANTPPANVDSLIGMIEQLRGQKLDRVTRTNFRIRNTWPELIQLQLSTDRDSSREGIRFLNTSINIDNATGYQIDQAIVKFTIWKEGRELSTDTVQFSAVNYSAPARRSVGIRAIGDSLSLAFLSLRAKSFNFCYSIDKKSNYGNYNDRWFCR